MTCPNCGHATPPSEVGRCGHCNFKLPANPQPQAARPDNTLPCWNCRHPNAPETDRCEHCNAKIQSHAAPFASRKPVNTSIRIPVNVSNHDE